ncbi:MAG: hypothetical protein ACXWDM_13595, partial [Nocardioides sp.]
MRAAVAAGRGVVTAHRLRECGIPGRLVAEWCRRGVLVPVRRGVYTTRELWESWDEYVARPTARIRAAHLTLRIPYVFSHDSAAIMQEVRLLRPQDSAVHITREDLRGSRSRFGIEHHGAWVERSRILRVKGLDVLDVPRTVADLAREDGYLAGLVAADGALHGGMSRSELTAAADEMAGWPYSLRVRAVVEDADDGAESVGETLMRDLVVGVLGQEVETQFPVLTRRGIRWCDLRVGRHLFEFDGRIKYQDPQDGGVADRELEQILWQERQRQVDVTDEAFGMTRLTYADHWGTARDGAERR